MEREREFAAQRDFSKPYSASKAKLIRLLWQEKAYRSLQMVNLYQPLPTQLEFHKCKARERLCIGGNRAGKTTSAIMEIAMAVMGKHPYLPYPKYDGRAIVVAKDGTQIAQIFYRKLFRSTFKIVKDPETGMFRAWKGHIPGEPPESETRPGFPVIPDRFIKTIAWENKAEQIPRLITFVNGWEILFCSSLGKPIHGIDLDMAAFDEEIKDGDSWYSETMARLVDRGGRFIWTATPQLATQKLWDLHERAISIDDDRGSIEEFRFLIDDNTSLGKQNIADFKATMAHDPEEYRVRVEGEFKITSHKVYPTFRKKIHTCLSFDIPPDWCRYLVLDPGYAKSAFMFFAVPPPESPEAGRVFVYDELYSQQIDVKNQVDRLYHKVQGQLFEAFLIDEHGARRGEMNGKSIGQQYADELEYRGIRAIATKAGFYGINKDSVQFGTRTLPQQVSQVRSWLWLREELGDKPILQIFEDRCPKLIKEMENYKNKLVEGMPTDEPDSRKFSEGPDCYDSETEVLTDHGWKKFCDLNRTESVATVNLDTDMIEYQFPSEYFSRHYSGEMVKVGGLSLDALVTPNHRMVTVTNKASGRSKIKLAGELSKWSCLKVTAKWTGEEFDRIAIQRVTGNCTVQYDSVDAGDFAEFLGWYIAEGCCTKLSKSGVSGRGYQVVVSQKYGEKRDHLRRLLARLPWKWNESRDSFYCSNKQLWTALRPLGDRSWKKVVPDWIRRASPALIERFISGAILGDGWIHKKDGSRCYATTSKALADGMQELFMKIGGHASVMEKAPQAPCVTSDGRTITAKRVQYVVRQRLSATCGLCTVPERKPKFWREQYDGMVYCVSVPNQTLIVRRNGKPLVCGNCLRYAMLYGVPYVKPKNPKPKKQTGKSWLDDSYESRKRARRQNMKQFLILGSGDAK